MTKTHILIIHGGMTFRNRKDYIHYLKTKKVSIEPRINWAGEYLEEKLGPKFKVIRPRMPQRENARYEEWKIFFERYVPLLKGKFILIGNSLGGMFLAKYLSEHRLPKKALSVYLVCPPYDNTVVGEDLVNRFKLKGDLTLLEKSTHNLRLLFSGNDEVVPVSHAKKYAKKLNKAEIHIYSGKNGHFNVATFPEIVRMIKDDVKKSK